MPEPVRVRHDPAARILSLARLPVALMMMATMAAASTAVSAETTPIPTAPIDSPPPQASTQEFLTPLTVTVPASGSLDVPLDLEGSSMAGITVLVPNASVSATIGGTPLAATESAFGRGLNVVVRDPTITTLHIVNGGSTPVEVQVLPSILTDRHVLIATAPWAMVGTAVPFSVLVTEPLDGDELIVRLADGSDPAVPPMGVTVTPNGPGRWTGSVTLAGAGPWTLLAQVTGERQRYAAAQITASAGHARLGDGFAERLVDSDLDTLADALVLSPELLVSQAGTYRVIGRLVTLDGHDVASAGQTAELAAGTHRVDLSFDGGRIFTVGAPGPYRLVDVQVYDEASSTGPEDRRADIGSTQGYEIDRFQHAPVVFDGTSFQSDPIDADGNGRYESIRLTGTVTVAVAGSYDLSAQLLADDGSLNGLPVDFASTRSLLDVGTNHFTLDFDGRAIQATGMDGPLRDPAAHADHAQQRPHQRQWPIDVHATVAGLPLRGPTGGFRRYSAAPA